MVFQIVGGFVGDRVPKNLALMVFTFIQCGSVFILIYGPATLGVAYGFAVVFGIGFGGRNPLTTSIRGDYFGRTSFGKIMGVSQVPMNVLLLLAPTFAGLMYDWQGDYTVAFTVLGRPRSCRRGDVPVRHTSGAPGARVTTYHTRLRAGGTL